jgi:serine protease Do
MRSWMWLTAGLILGGLIGTSLTTTMLHGEPLAPPVIPKELTSYRDVVKKVLPAVVSIEAKVKPTKGKPRTDKTGFKEQFLVAPDKDEDSLGFGSGFIVDSKGVILTNFHVVEDADSLEITLIDGRKFTSKDFVSDVKTDLAVVRIQPPKGGVDLPSLQLADSNEMEIGDRVLAVGAPFGLTGSVSHGIISGKKRSLHVNSIEDFLQTDAAINPGNSGGPLVNLEGKVVGISSAIKSRNGGFQGVGLAISSNLVSDILKQLLRAHPYLGVRIKDVDTEEMAKQLGLKQVQGVQITRVLDDGPAARAELVKGDVILNLAGKVVKDTNALQDILAGLPLGKPVPVTIVRAGKSQSLEITIVEAPKEPAPK